MAGPADRRICQATRNGPASRIGIYREIPPAAGNNTAISCDCGTPLGVRPASLTSALAPDRSDDSLYFERDRVPFALGCKPSLASMMPAFASSWLNVPLSVRDRSESTRLGQDVRDLTRSAALRRVTAMTERWLTIDGYRYACRVHPGPACARPVFFLNGAFQTMDSWGRFMNHYRLFRTVILCDLPGTGQSDELPATFGLDFFGRALRLVLDTAGVAQAHLFGASYGAPVAYRFAQMYPERVGSMALAGVARQLPDHVRARTAGTLEIVRAGRLSEFAREGVDILIGAGAASRVTRGHVVRRVLENGLARLTSRQQRQYIAATTRLLTHPPLDLAAAPSARTLVLTGEHDIYTRPEDCREVADALPHARFVTIPRAGHLFHLERPEIAIDVFSEFLADVERPAPALAPGTEPRKDDRRISTER